MNKVTQFFLALLFLIALFAVGLWYFPVIKTNEKLREQELELVERINKQRLENDSLRRSIASIRTNPRVIESLAREILHYARRDELVVWFKPDDSPGNNRNSLPNIFSRQ